MATLKGALKCPSRIANTIAGMLSSFNFNYKTSKYGRDVIIPKVYLTECSLNLLGVVDRLPPFFCLHVLSGLVDMAFDSGDVKFDIFPGHLVLMLGPDKFGSIKL